jgi:hypothetical protein
MCALHPSISSLTIMQLFFLCPTPCDFNHTLIAYAPQPSKAIYTSLYIHQKLIFLKHLSLFSLSLVSIFYGHLVSIDRVANLQLILTMHLHVR